MNMVIKYDEIEKLLNEKARLQGVLHAIDAYTTAINGTYVEKDVIRCILGLPPTADKNGSENNVPF